MPIKEKIEVEMLSPLMAEFIPDYSDIVDLDDAEPLEGPDLVQYPPSIARKVDEINRIGMPDNQPCNLIDYFDRNKDITLTGNRRNLRRMRSAQSWIPRSQAGREPGYTDLKSKVMADSGAGFGKEQRMKVSTNRIKTDLRS